MVVEMLQKFSALEIDQFTDNEESGWNLVMSVNGPDTEFRIYHHNIPSNGFNDAFDRYVVVEWVLPNSGVPGPIARNFLAESREMVTVISDPTETLAQWRAWDYTTNYVLNKVGNEWLTEATK